MNPETLRVAAFVVCSLGLTLVALFVARPKLNDAAERYHTQPVSIFTALLSALLLTAAALAFAGRAMASGWEPFTDARIALPWPYESRELAKSLGLLVPLGCALVAAGATALLVRRTNAAIALGSVICLAILGFAAANPVVLPMLLLLSVFAWGHSINERSKNGDPLNWLSILIVGVAWVCLVVGLLAGGAVAGVFLGVGAVTIVAVIVRVWYREGVRLALETIVCGTLQAALYSTGVAFVLVLIAGYAQQSKSEADDA